MTFTDWEQAENDWEANMPDHEKQPNYTPNESEFLLATEAALLHDQNCTFEDAIENAGRYGYQWGAPQSHLERHPQTISNYRRRTGHAYTVKGL